METQKIRLYTQAEVAKIVEATYTGINCLNSAYTVDYSSGFSSAFLKDARTHLDNIPAEVRPENLRNKLSQLAQMLGDSK